jgi:hypothetical protein
MDEGLHGVNDEIKRESGRTDDDVRHMFAYIADGNQGRFQVELAKSEDARQRRRKSNAGGAIG